MHKIKIIKIIKLKEKWWSVKFDEGERWGEWLSGWKWKRNGGWWVDVKERDTINNVGPSRNSPRTNKDMGGGGIIISHNHGTNFTVGFNNPISKTAPNTGLGLK